MTSPIADGVMAATYKLVQQAMTGQWQDVPKTIEERRVLLDQLSASATAQDQQWLAALKQAMAESDAAVAKMATAPTTDALIATPDAARTNVADGAQSVDSMLDMIRGGR
jgi:recombinational DNA repair ATPase RecF